MDTTTFLAKKAELIRLIKSDQDAMADRDGLKPLQQRSIEMREIAVFQDVLLEGELCADMYRDILDFTEEELRVFVSYVSDLPTSKDCLRRRFNHVYLIHVRGQYKPDISANCYMLLLCLVIELGEYKPIPGEILNDKFLVSVKNDYPGGWLQILLHFDDPKYYEEELIGGYGELYGYEHFGLLDTAQARVFGVESVERVFERIKEKMDEKEIGFYQKFLVEYKT